MRIGSASGNRKTNQCPRRHFLEIGADGSACPVRPTAQSFFHGIVTDAAYMGCMNIGSYFRLEGILLAGAVGLYVQARDGVFWEISGLGDVGHLLQANVVVEGIRTGAEAISVNWIEAIEPLQRLISTAGM
ncbi:MULTISPECIES: DUF5818 domain-containing protein [Sphingobium]|uniref:DUF5818 domain-containing protein n=1 Tax=Sphingobium TaxID=165695 RepID=UPI00159C1387|nr:DUF5818 domain-containing protein [Sphingobium sp. 15-1]